MKNNFCTNFLFLIKKLVISTVPALVGNVLSDTVFHRARIFVAMFHILVTLFSRKSYQAKLSRSDTDKCHESRTK